MKPLPNDHALLRPENPAVTVFRGTLWLLPTVFVVISLIGVEWGGGWSGFPVDILVVPALGLSVVFSIGAGWFNAWLSVDAHIHPSVVRWKTLKFSLLQLLIIPGVFISGSILLCSFNYLRVWW
ncbi:hypothetical protein JIN84_20355 [Luteolibacter yonseiensis]|uniref:Uncharacterized protein n=1 Tax=Luteolibacter yonseiensis TaxID=1144680 RepID=A0A934VDG1_9BACT|nr:hypothetical protein [Luteolibacter yonseiensis]MBK1817986.1 hypothetical protein [Luteolibacter yonseiensis]